MTIPYKYIILPPVFCVCKILSVSLRIEHRVENSVLVRIFGPKRGEVTGEWRKVNNEEFHVKYCLPKVACQYILLLMSFIINNQEILQSN